VTTATSLLDRSPPLTDGPIGDSVPRWRQPSTRHGIGVSLQGKDALGVCHMGLRIIYWLRQRKTDATGAEIPPKLVDRSAKTVDCRRADNGRFVNFGLGSPKPAWTTCSLPPVMNAGDRTDTTDHGEAVALFRSEVVGVLTRLDLPRGELSARLKTLSEQRFRPPGATTTRTFAVTTRRQGSGSRAHGGAARARLRGASRASERVGGVDPRHPGARGPH
jgi:hypothetical protein